MRIKENLWSDKEVEDKKKLMYSKEEVNPNLQKYLCVLTSLKKRINIAIIRTNSHEIHSESGHCTISITPWHERIHHLCDTNKVGDENHLILDFPYYT